MDAKLERKKNYIALAVALLEDLPMGASFSVWFAFRRWGFGHENYFCSLFDARRRVEHCVPRQFDGRVRRSEVSMERTEHLQQHQP